jgi:hypothetical protein
MVAMESHDPNPPLQGPATGAPKDYSEDLYRFSIEIADE